MTAPDEDEHPGVVKIKAMWERGEFEKLDRMIRWWEALENLGKLGEVFKRFIIWCGIIAGGYFALTGQLTEWIRSIR